LQTEQEFQKVQRMREEAGIRPRLAGHPRAGKQEFERSYDRCGGNRGSVFIEFCTWLSDLPDVCPARGKSPEIRKEKETLSSGKGMINLGKSPTASTLRAATRRGHQLSKVSRC
jgi:hypothetical protein